MNTIGTTVKESAACGFENRDARIYVAGHRGMVGGALTRALHREGYRCLISRTSGELDLREQEAVRHFFWQEKPEYVFLAAAKVGGIYANQSHNADFLYENMMIEMNVMHAALECGVKKLLFLGSSCIYPRMAKQPIPESELLTGPLEPTNEGYALAKIAGLRYCTFLNRQYGTQWISVMPTNLYGPGDNYHPMNSHVLPALLRRFHEAKCNGEKRVTVWGTGKPLREFLYADDLADACLYLMRHYAEDETVNIGSGEEVSIARLARMIADTVGYTGEIVFDHTKPDGTPRKLLDLSRLNRLGWHARTTLEEGLKLAYRDFLNTPVREER